MRLYAKLQPLCLKPFKPMKLKIEENARDTRFYKFTHSSRLTHRKFIFCLCGSRLAGACSDALGPPPRLPMCTLNLESTNPPTLSLAPFEASRPPWSASGCIRLPDNRTCVDRLCELLRPALQWRGRRSRPTEVPDRSWSPMVVRLCLPPLRVYQTYSRPGLDPKEVPDRS